MPCHLAFWKLPEALLSVRFVGPQSDLRCSRVRIKINRLLLHFKVDVFLEETMIRALGEGSCPCMIRADVGSWDAKIWLYLVAA